MFTMAMADLLKRRDFIERLARMGVVCAAGFSNGSPLATVHAADPGASAPLAVPAKLLSFPPPWSFALPKGGMILVSDAQLTELTDPDKEIDLSLSSTPNRTTLRKVCAEAQASGATTVILAFDEFWSQYRPGQGGKPRQLTPDTEGYVALVKKISDFMAPFGLGLELSLLSPLEVGPAYNKQTGESGRWVQYREGWRDPKTGAYAVSLWEHRRWTNNKGAIEVKRAGVRVFAFRESRIGGTDLFAVNPADIQELKDPPEIRASESDGPGFPGRRLDIRGAGDAGVGPLDRVLVVVSYKTPELDYFSPSAGAFLTAMVERYRAAGVHLNGLYSDEIHIQQDWAYNRHHDEGQFTLRYMTASLQAEYAKRYGAEFSDLEKYLVYFCYGQHGFLPGIEARNPAQHVLGGRPEDTQRTFLLRRRYYDLLELTVTNLFVGAKRHAEKLYGHELEARAHATWAQSPTIDFWRTGGQRMQPRQYEYTPDFEWSNTIHQAAAACSDYFRWNDFLTGGGNDHAEGGWSDRDYYGLALACSTGILNSAPNAYAAAWGMPGPALERHQALADVYGAAANPFFQNVQDCEHRDIEVLMLYPMSLVACEERFGSWMTQYGYANYVTAEKLLQRGEVQPDGAVLMAGRRFTTIVALFEPLPPAGLIPFLETVATRGGRVVWSGPAPHFDLEGKPTLEAWRRLFGLSEYNVPHLGLSMPGARIDFLGRLAGVEPQTVLTDFLVDLLYPVTPDAAAGTEIVARSGPHLLGTHRPVGTGGSATFIGFRPRDDQAASLGYEMRVWFETLLRLGAYPPGKPGGPTSKNDNPAVLSRNSPYLVTRFTNGAIAVAAHYRSHVEGWAGGFHRDEKQDAEVLARNPLPPEALELKSFQVQGRMVEYKGRLAMTFRLDSESRLVGFCGYDADRIVIDGRETRFASKPVPLISWAPVQPKRRVPGGAILELWADGGAEFRIPLTEPAPNPRLFVQGPTAGSAGEAVPCSVREGKLVFTNPEGGGRRRLFLVA